MKSFNLEQLGDLMNGGIHARKQQGVENGLRYKAEKDAKHSTINPSDFVSVYGQVHRVKNGNYFTLVHCSSGTGTPCPICKKINDAWEMINKLADETVEGMAEDKKVEAKKKVQKEQMSIIQARAFEKKTDYIYYAVAQLRDVTLTSKKFEAKETFNYTFEDGESVEIPAFDIKLKRVTGKAMQSLVEGFKLEEEAFNGGVVLTVYSDTDDPMLLGKDKTVKIIAREVISDVCPRLQEAIDAEVRKLFKAVKQEDGKYKYNLDVFKESFNELDEERVNKIDIDGIASNVLGIWYDYKEYIKENPDCTFISYKGGNGTSNAEVPQVNLDADDDQVEIGTGCDDAIARATPVDENNNDLPF